MSFIPDYTEYIKNEYLEMWIKQGLIYCKYFPGTVVDLKAAHTILKDRLFLLNGRNLPHYVDVRNGKYWTKEAREFQSTSENNKGMTAAGFVLNSKVVGILMNFYLIVNKPNVPQKAFWDEKEAFNWIIQFR